MTNPRRLCFQTPAEAITKKFNRDSLLSLWAIFSISLTVRLFNLHSQNTPIMEEYEYCKQLIDLSYHDISRPIIGDLISRMPILLTNYNSSDLSFNESNLFIMFPQFGINKYINVFLSSLIPPIICATLLLFGYPLFVSTCSCLLLSFEFCNVLRSRVVCNDSLFNLLTATYLLMTSMKQYCMSRSFSIILSLIIALANVIDYSGFALIVFCLIDILIIQKNKEYHNAGFLILMVFFLQIIDLYIQFSVIHNGSHNSEKIHSFIDLISCKFQSLFCFDCRRYPVYIFPLWKYIPKTVWNNDKQKITLMNHPLVTFLSALFCSFGILHKFSVYYFLSIWLIWAIKRPTNCSEYQIPFFFSIIAITHYLSKWRFRNVFILIVFLAHIGLFVLWAPWIYALEISEPLDSLLDFWHK